MTRSISPQTLVSIPSRSAEGSYVLATRLLTASREETLPPSLAEPLADVERCVRGLHDSMLSRLTSGALDTRAAQDADRRLDAAWGGFRDWLSSWVRLGDATPRATEVRELFTFLFSDGLNFLSERFDRQWTSSATRLEGLRAARNDELVRALGGGLMLDALFAAHEAYGRALGTTAPLPANEAAVRPALDDLHGALREYVIAVVATIRRHRPETQPLADRLLRPITESK